LPDGLLSLFEKNFDMKFVEEFDACLQQFYSANLSDYCHEISLHLENMSAKSSTDIMFDLASQKQYEGILYFLRLLQPSMYGIGTIKHDLERRIENKHCPLILRECPPEFLKQFFDILEVPEKKIDKYYLIQACLADTDTLFFEMIGITKYYKHARDRVLCWAAQSGHMRIIEWAIADATMHQKTIELTGIYIDNRLFDAFDLACYFGHIDVVKRLLELKKNIHQNNEMAFFAACINGHTDIAKYLIELGETTAHGRIDIHAKCPLLKGTNIITKIICEHYDLAEWLFVLGIESYGVFDLRKEIFKIENRAHNNELCVDESMRNDVENELRNLRDQIQKLSIKYHYDINIDDVSSSVSSDSFEEIFYTDDD